ncbi:MAG: amidohydrolase family protein [Pseudohongiella sp.]|nr:amidohydrolase family protein [Pseudohongiella sp.]
MLRFTLRAVLVLCCFLVLSGALLLQLPLSDPPAPRPVPLAQQGRLILDNVRILDTDSGDVSPPQAIWLEEGKISRISAASIAADSVPDYQYQDGAGAFVIPGLWDSHTHSMQLSPQIHHPFFLANGVTYLRDMSGCMIEHDTFQACAADRQRWQQEAQAGQRSSPFYPQQSSFALNGGSEVPADFPAFLRLQSEADASALTAHYQGLGVNNLKTYELLSSEQYQWLSRAAARAGMTLAGHQPWQVTLNELIAGGQRSVEHGRVFLFECSAIAMTLKQQPMRAGLINADVWRQIIDSQDPALCQGKMARMAAAGLWWSPTLLTLQLGARASDAAFRQDARLAQVPWGLRQLWQADADGMMQRGQDQRGHSVHQDLLALAQQQLYQAVNLGVPIIAGTDSPDSFVFSGSGLIDELQLYVEAGLTPLQALQSATLWPAQYAGRLNSAGSVDVGKDANLVLLSANPLEDIGALRQVQGLVLAGYWYDKNDLDALQWFGTKQAASMRLNLQLAWSALRSAPFRMQFAD